jgi:predicted pyridoxine 5'-phosphate oxidase superfamily flavin-nucleotide-binding protein
LAEKVQLGFKAVVDVIKQNNKEVYRLPVMVQLGTIWKEDGNVDESPQPHIIEPPTLSTYKWWSDIIDYE